MKYSGLGLVILALILIAGSCSPFQMMDKRSKVLAANKEGVIRGMYFDLPIDSVKKLEMLPLIEEQPDYLRYIMIPEDFPQDTLEVEYIFNGDLILDFIAINYRTPEDDDIKDMTGNLKEFFEDKYGSCRQDELGWHTWDLKDTIGIPGTIEIVLKSETQPEYKGVKLELVKYFAGE